MCLHCQIFKFTSNLTHTSVSNTNLKGKHIFMGPSNIIGWELDRFQFYHQNALYFKFTTSTKNV